MKIAIVNDSLLAVEVLRRVVVTVTGYEVIWTAQNGEEAVNQCLIQRPDLILMDLVMPELDGVEATRQIMQRSPCAILIVTASVDRYASKVFEAMGYGALDAINTPIVGTGTSTEGGRGLLAKIATIAKLIGKSPRQRSRQTAPYQPLVPPLIVIGASTGGPQALVKLLSQFDPPFPAAIMVIQHVDAQFAPGFVTWLAQQIRLPVTLAIADQKLEPGTVTIAGTTDHLVVREHLTLAYTAEPKTSIYRPSVDVFFQSVAKFWTRPGIAVLLTGMGRDGAQGLSQLRTAGWHTIVQDESSCVVYGMPKAAIEIGAAIEVLPIDSIAPACLRYLTVS